MASRIAIVVSHPIQHFVPFYRALAQEDEIDLTVIYASRIGLDPYFDEAMNIKISWKMDLLSGYASVFLPEANQIKSARSQEINNPSVSDELTRQAPEVVLIYGYTQPTSLRALWWCRKNSVPAIMISDSELKTVRPALLRFVKYLLLPILFKQFCCFITVGDENENYYLHYGVAHKKLFRSPFTIDEESYISVRANRPSIRKETRARLRIDQDEIVALTVGKLVRRKRPGDILAASKILKDNKFSSKLSFLIAGDGEEMGPLQEIAASSDLPVRFLGFVNVDELPNIYAAADIIIHPSSRDPHPLVLSEAACIGMPLLLCDQVGAVGRDDIARLGENALTFPVGDVATLSDHLKTLVLSPRLRSAMSSASQRIFSELDVQRSVAGLKEAIRFATSNC